MSTPLFSLLRQRHFGPLFVTQFLGAFVDNLFRFAMATLIAYELVESPQTASLLSLLGGAVFILPFFLFSATSGQLADRLDKARIARANKIAELAIMGVGVWALHSGSIAAMFVVLFLLGVQSAVFGPVKYGILPQHLAADDLLKGNALVEAGTFLAILFGQILGVSLLGQTRLDPTLVTTVGLAASVVGVIAAHAIPTAPAPAPDLRMNYNPWTATAQLLRLARTTPVVWRTILALSWFWAVGTVITAQMIPLTQAVLRADTHVATVLLALFSVGIGIGCALVTRLAQGRPSVRWAARAALVMAIVLGLLSVALVIYTPHASDTLITLSMFMATPSAWPIAGLLVLLAMAGGAYSVPLYTLLQTAAAPEMRARMIAANNIVNALFMALAAAVAGVIVALTGSITALFAALATATGLAAFLLRHWRDPPDPVGR